MIVLLDVAVDGGLEIDDGMKHATLEALGARLRGSEQRHGRDAGAQHRPGAGEGTDRAEEPRLQHAPPGAVGAPRHGRRPMRVSLEESA